MILTFLAQNWRMAVIAALVGANITTFQLWRHSANSLSEYRRNAELVAEAEAERVAAILARQEQITKETTDGWKAAVDYLHAHPQRVLSRYCSGDGVSASAAGADDPSQGPVLTPARIEEDAAAAVLTLNQLQTWIEKQRGVK
jgi:hypothetical protein